MRGGRVEVDRTFRSLPACESRTEKNSLAIHRAWVHPLGRAVPCPMGITSSQILSAGSSGLQNTSALSKVLAEFWREKWDNPSWYSGDIKRPDSQHKRAPWSNPWWRHWVK